MLIKESGAGLSIKDQVIEASLQKIGVLCTNNAVITDALLALSTISVTRNKKGGGSSPVIYPMSLQACLEIASAKEGLYKSSVLDGKSLFGTIDISEFGTLLLDQDYLTVSVDNGGGANFNITLFAIEGNKYTRSSIEYVPNMALADTPKMVNVADCTRVALPVANFLKVVLYYQDGRTATYTTNELAMICADINSVVSALADGTSWTITTGFKNLYVIPVKGVVNMQVHFSDASKFFTIRNS